MSASKLRKIAQIWADKVSTGLEGFVQLTEQQLRQRMEAIADNVTGTQNADTSVANPKVAIEALFDNATIIMGNTYEAAGHKPPETESPAL